MNTKRLLSCVVLSVLALSLTGCTIVKVLARGNQPLILNTPNEHYTVVNHFKKSKQITFDYTSAPDITAMVREGLTETPDADAVVNTFITVENTVGDFFFNLITLGIARSYTVTVEGDAIKYEK